MPFSMGGRGRHMAESCNQIPTRKLANHQRRKEGSGGGGVHAACMAAREASECIRLSHTLLSCV